MPRANYSFVDNIRCLAILAIVIEHTSFLGTYVFSASSSPYWAYITSLQIVKFGTISFFIIAGFLFAENKDKYSFFEYLKRRFNNIFKPWLIWSLTFLFLLTIGTFIEAIRTGVSAGLIISGLWWGVKTVYLYSNYWFIFNFFFCTIILLLSKKIIASWKFGLTLFAFTCFYSVNIYTEWVTTQHTTALLGFVFFYWLGVQLNLHFKKIEQKIKNIPIVYFFIPVVVSLFIAVQEASYLFSLKNEDPINTLRFSNILFSIAVFMFLLKVRKFDWLAPLQPRKTTYGIFLIHYILVFAFLPFILGKANTEVISQFSIADMYIYQFSRFLVVYISSFALVTMIYRSNFSWMIGVLLHPKPASEQISAITIELQPQILETEAA
jgi:hypothetical protein